MKRFNKIYIEITNRCNLNCSFCPGTSRPGKFLSVDEFSKIISAAAGFTDFVYFHLMGEPLLHPQLAEFIDIASAAGLKVCLTTNGTLLKKCSDVLTDRLSAIHKISISIQAREANGAGFDDDDPAGSNAVCNAGADAACSSNKKSSLFESYLENCFEFGKAVEGKTIVAYRLWNEGGEDKDNENIMALMKKYFPQDWVRDHNSFAVGNRIFLELGEKFDWPDPDADDIGKSVCNTDGSCDLAQYYCRGLKDQIGILVDGTVVPCCLDNEGRLALGNIFDTSLDEIIGSPRAMKIVSEFKNRRAAEELCKHCGFAKRFV